ncbi:MAG TPA: sigma-54 dependent transcriptional regulator [Pirellulales bacterium]|nr:sigma-54 dependent transcriptional regulator [Pirellulales bacterium]
MSHVLIIDDEESICWALRRLAREDGHEVSVASSAEDALELAVGKGCDLVVLDIRLPGMDGLTALSRFRQLLPDTPVVVITAFGSLATAVEAVRNGAFEYLTKPFDLEQALAVIRRALTQRALAQRALADHPSRPLPQSESNDELVGTSPAMQEVFKRIALAAPSRASVLITGESGTGKELVAQAIHRHSPRADGPLVPVNLAALSPTLVESELFGHVRGAFTGADFERKGLLEMAHGGTVFFDEAGDIPLPVQVKLLRALEQQETTPVGGVNARPTEFRVVAATHRDLRREVCDGKFREDLYFRLAVFEIQLPSLRERVDDIPALAERFLRQIRPAVAPAVAISEAALDELRRRPWPGNARELRNAIEHAALLARNGPILPEHLPSIVASLPGGGSDVDTAVREWALARLADEVPPENLYQQLLDLVEPPLLDAVLERTGQNRVAAANVLGIHRATLRKKLG